MAAVSPSPSPSATADARLTDSHGRVIHDLRVSVTDRCNYKCVYCRTGEVGAQYAELPIADYLRVIRLFVDLGITKVRLTGGEPLLRRGLVDMVRELSGMHTAGGDRLDVAITTNGHALAELAEPLKAAGLSRVTVSMDAVDAAMFERITRVPGSYRKVLAGIRAARAAGLTPLKVNCVLLRGFNDDQVEGFAHFAREEDVVVRFIEFMPLEEGRLWTPEIVVPLKEIVSRIGRVVLRSVQPRPPHLRRQNPDLPVLPAGTRSLQPDARRCNRCGTSRNDSPYRPGERSTPPHRGAGIPAAIAFHGPHRRVIRPPSAGQQRPLPSR